jgi:hypothetical protein
MRWYFSVIRRYRVQYRISINTITCIAHREINSVIFLGRNSLGKLLVLLIITAPEIHLHVYNYKRLSYCGNCIGGVMVSVFVSSAIDRGFVPRPGQTKDYKIGVLLLLL